MPAEATYALRQRLLRPHQTLDEVRALHSGDHPETATLAAVLIGAPNDTVIATTSVRPERCPWLPDREDAWRLRGMATEPAYRGQGLGTALLNAALAHVAMAGGGLVWCNARIPAEPFYRRAGFCPYGREWADPLIGPHLCMWRELSPGRPTGRPPNRRSTRCQR